ncbi:MAG: hypothetical protein IT371_20400 [Deltaproteobacteria bacterium]|nr:hypothetical protein [Deltaproteobacteria bacterium]
MSRSTMSGAVCVLTLVSLGVPAGARGVGAHGEERRVAPVVVTNQTTAAKARPLSTRVRDAARAVRDGALRAGGVAVPLVAGGLTYSLMTRSGLPAFASGSTSYVVANAVDFALHPKRQREEVVVEGAKLVVGALGAGAAAHVLRDVAWPSALSPQTGAVGAAILRGTLFDAARGAVLRATGAATHWVVRMAGVLGLTAYNQAHYW